MTSVETVRTVEYLLRHFDNTLVDQFQTFISISLEGKSLSVAELHDVVSQHLFDIVNAMDQGAYTEFIKQPMILRIFTKFHQMILSMTDPWSASNTKKAGKIKRDNDLKWKMMCDFIEQLLLYLHRHDIMSSEFVWTEMIRNHLLQRTNPSNHFVSARNAILLCRILLVLGEKLFRDNKDESLLNECSRFLVQFVIDFVPRDFKKYEEYNDLHTMLDMEDALKLIAQYITEQSEVSAVIKDNKLRKDNKQMVETTQLDTSTVYNDGVLTVLSEDSKSGKSGKVEKPKDSNHFMNTKDDALHQQIVSHYTKTRVKGKERAQKEELISHIGRCWKKVLIASSSMSHSSRHSNGRMKQKKLRRLNGRKFVGLFGSTACKLDSAGSDIDLYVTLPSEVTLSTAGEWSVFKYLSQELSRKGNGYRNKLKVINIFNCTVPIIKMTDAVYHIDADLSFGKQWENGQIVKLINMFCEHRGDEVVRQFIVAVKHWANRRRLNDSQSNRLNSFGWVLMAIRYLQSVHVLPRIRRCGAEKEEFEFVAVDMPKRILLQYGEGVSLGMLMRGFFTFWARWDYDTLSISLYKEVVQKRKRRYFDLSGWELKEAKLVFVIEDPVQRNYNCSKNVRKYTANLMRIEFYRSKMVLNYGDGDFHCLCRSVR